VIEIIREFLPGFSVSTAFIAAGCWWYSALIKAEYKPPPPPEDDVWGATVRIDGQDLAENLQTLRLTLVKQSVWNARAAFFAGLSVAALGVIQWGILSVIPG